MTETTPITLHGVYELLLAWMGHTLWWPADTRFEIAVGAILVQNTAWQSAQKAIDNLRDADALSPGAIIALSDERLQELIRPAGFHRSKSGYLKAFCTWFAELGPGADGEVPTLVADRDDARLRGELLAIRGVGGETADDLMLYVFDRPAFIADRYARRVCETLGVTDLPKSYEGFRRRVMPGIEAGGWSLDELKEFHGLIDEFAKTCRTAEDWRTSILAGHRLILG